MRIGFLFGLVMLAGACGPVAPPVNVQGADLDISIMAGHWEGTYEGIDSGRKGTIQFDLTVGSRMAEGKVVMNAADPAKATTLRIKFVAFGKREVSGKIEPYLDPSCKCMVDTEFVGTPAGKTISGTFTTKPQGGTQVAKGKWEVKRKD
jgi:hypothetical protein